MSDKAIQIDGRRWKCPNTGNSYHSVEIFVDEELVQTIPYTYGYGDHYVETGYNWLREEGYFDDNGGVQKSGGSVWKWREYFEANGWTTDYSVEQVDTKEELHEEPQKNYRLEVMVNCSATQASELADAIALMDESDDYPDMAIAVINVETDQEEDT